MPIPTPRTALQTSAVLGLEAAWLGARLAGYPLGVGRERAARHQPAVRPHQQALATADVPVLLVHGLVDNRSVFSVLRRSLRRRGFRHVVAMNYPVLTTDVRAAARLLADRVEALCAETGADRVHVVGHSLGGLIARWYVQEMGGDARVDTIVTVGTPHAGTAVARAFPLAVCRQLAPGSDVVRRLAEPTRCRTRIVSLWSETDELMVPRTSARLDHDDLDVRNVRVRGVGHVSLPIHPAVLAEVTRLLAPPPVAATAQPLATVHALHA